MIAALDRATEIAAQIKDACDMACDCDTDGVALSAALWHAATGLAALAQAGNAAAIEALLARMWDAMQPVDLT